MRYGYAVEYDFAPPDQLQPCAGDQARGRLGILPDSLNGTTGYEEAWPRKGWWQGRSLPLCGLAGREPLVLDRNQAYIGVC